MRIYTGIWLLTLILFAGTAAYPQVASTSIRGKVVYPDGSPAIGAKAIAKSVPTGSLFAALTDSTGVYRIPGIETGGPYTLEISVEGYETFTKTDIYLTLSPCTVDARLTKKEAKTGKSVAFRQADSSVSLAGNRRARVRVPSR